MGMGEDPHGVSLEQFTAYVAEAFGHPESEFPAIADTHGIPPEHLQAVTDEWNRRTSTDQATLLRYNELYQQELHRLGVQRPEITLEQYAEMMKAVQAGTPADQVCAQYGMTLQQWALVNQHMGEQMMANSSLAMRYAKLLGIPGVG